MACVNSDGSLTASARQMLALLEQPHTPEQASAESGQPLFKVRSSLREMAEAGLVEVDGDKYVTSAQGREQASN